MSVVQTPATLTTETIPAHFQRWSVAMENRSSDRPSRLARKIGTYQQLGMREHGGNLARSWQRGYRRAKTAELRQPAGAFAVFGGHGATACSTIVYEVEPGKRLGWHTDATEETQYIISYEGKLYLEDGSAHDVGPGSVFVLPTPLRYDLENTGKETLRAVAFFAAAMFTQDFDQVMLPPRSHILGTPNREG
jgi:quercetin dioxygenase-like cupin family protein